MFLKNTLQTSTYDKQDLDFFSHNYTDFDYTEQLICYKIRQHDRRQKFNPGIWILDNQRTIIAFFPFPQAEDITCQQAIAKFRRWICELEGY
jgi:hypothetical protein